MRTSPRMVLWSGVLVAGASLLYGGRSRGATTAPEPPPQQSAVPV